MLHIFSLSQYNPSTNTTPLQYRSNWSVNPTTGTYTSPVRTPTGIPSDPALASYGVKQAEQLATKLLALDPSPAKAIYSSPYYRCLQTIAPYTTELAQRGREDSVRVTIEPGLGEFYGQAPFSHPSPAGIDELNRHFPHLRAEAEPIIVPSVRGESIPALHNRMAYTLSQLIARADQQPNGPKAILLCTHAAAIIAIGRVLTGRMPEDVGEEDFRCFTCGLSKFVRRRGGSSEPESTKQDRRWSPERPDEIPEVDWRDGKGVSGGWECELNSDCSFLENGEERGW